VACEAITNAQKHADAASITVTYTVTPSDVCLVVTDDGRGGADPDGTGLRGLRDRVEVARGILTVDSSAATGTTLEAQLPCA
jgi:signal transduction histidine kinase